jgi:hypothetical protein
MCQGRRATGKGVIWRKQNHQLWRKRKTSGMRRAIKENKGEMEEGRKMIHPSSLEKPLEVEEKPHKWR